MLGLLLAVSLTATPPPLSNFLDAAGLLGHCAARDDAAPMRRSLCYGYVAGALDQVLMQQATMESEARSVCPPADLTLGGLVASVLDHASWAAREKGLGASGLVKFALEQAFPCAPVSVPM